MNKVKHSCLKQSSWTKTSVYATSLLNGTMMINAKGFNQINTPTFYHINRIKPAMSYIMLLDLDWV